MAKLSKRFKAFKEKIEHGKQYAIDDALTLLKEIPAAKFVESVDVSINLGVDPRKSDQVVRGSTVLPQGTGKTMKVAVFADGPDAEAATGPVWSSSWPSSSTELQTSARSMFSP